MRGRVHRWVRHCFIIWAIFSTPWLANTMRTRGFSPDLLRSSPRVTVDDGSSLIEFPADAAGVAAIVLAGTTHPKKDDLSALQLAVTKIYAMRT